MITFARGTYRPGPDRLVYVADDAGATKVVARVYCPCHHKNVDRHVVELRKLEPKVFILDFDFQELGNYIFVLEEDGEISAILNAKVYA